MSIVFERDIANALANEALQRATWHATAKFKGNRILAVAPRSLPDYQELRTAANALKRHTIDHLDWYLEQFESAVQARGGKVHWCRDGVEAADVVLGIAKRRGARLIVKSKSMTSEEIHLNARLSHHGLESVETDLGEYIIQLLDQRPYHIIAPAVNLTRHDVARVFEEKLGVPWDSEIPHQTQTARRVLREKFLAAGIGISGANFLVADSGAIVLVENEGNARLTTTAPGVHIAIAGIEKVIPRAQDLAVFLKLLARSATGQAMSVYTSFLAGPRRSGEVDGPEEFHVILLDGGRTKLLRDEEKRQSLYCIRCGACLNTCPVYRRIGGHSYPWVYSGPIGAILTPQFHGPESEPGLPFASSLCGACGEVCPVKIEIPKVLLRLRQEAKEAELQQGAGQAERASFQAFAYAASRPAVWRLAMRAARAMQPRLPKKAMALAAPLRGWMSERDLPELAPKSFRELWKERRR